MRSEISQVKSVATKIFMSQQTAQLGIRTREEKSVATKENSVATKIAKESKKSCCNIENSVATKKIMLRQFPEAEVYEELGAINFMSRHKTFLSRQEQDCWIKTLSRNYQRLSRQNPRKSSKNRS